MSDFKTVLRNLGGLFTVIGITSLATLSVPLYFGEYGSNSSFDGIGPILITSAIFFGFGVPLYLGFRKTSPPNFKTAMVIATLGWLFVSIIGSIPLFLLPYNKESLLQMDFLSAFFESMSGWTGTGLTLVPVLAYIYPMDWWSWCYSFDFINPCTSRYWFIRFI
jgi:trk system potassium uptake protein TrkH